MKTAIKLFNSLKYSLQGLYYIYKTELSFRLEVYYLFLSGVAIFFLYPDYLTPLEITIQLSTILLLLFAETINTVIEHIVDHLSKEKSHFGRVCKDMGSTGVFFLIIISILQWVIFIIY